MDAMVYKGMFDVLIVVAQGYSFTMLLFKLVLSVFENQAFFFYCRVSEVAVTTAYQSIFSFRLHVFFGASSTLSPLA